MCEHNSITINPIQLASEETGKPRLYVRVVCANCGDKIVERGDYAVLQGPAAYLAVSLWRPDKLSDSAKEWIERHGIKWI